LLGTGSILDATEPRGCRGLVRDLVTRCGGGDEAALATLFDLFHPVASALALAHLPERPVTDAVLEAFRRIWRRAGTYEPDSQNAVAWVLEELEDAVAVGLVRS